MRMKCRKLIALLCSVASVVSFAAANAYAIGDDYIDVDNNITDSSSNNDNQIMTDAEYNVCVDVINASVRDNGADSRAAKSAVYAYMQTLSNKDAIHHVIE